jgi:hypothetical protein
MPNLLSALPVVLAAVLATAAPALAADLTAQNPNPKLIFHDTGAAPATVWEFSSSDFDTTRNKFVLADTTLGKPAFSVISSGGPSGTQRFGFGTDAPLLPMHLVAADTPALRLEQTNGGSGAQTWDVAGNEGNFFVRDVTGGSTLPFRIRIGAPTSSIDIARRR